MTYQECLTYLVSQRNVPDEIWNAEDAKEGAVEYLVTLTTYPETTEELLDNYLAFLAEKLNYMLHNLA